MMVTKFLASKCCNVSKCLLYSKWRRNSNKMKSSKEQDIAVTTTMSKAYQITVPSVVRKALGLEPGDPLDIRIEKGQMVVRRAETREEQVKRVFAKLDQIREAQFKRMTPEQRKFVEMSRGWTVRQYHEYIDNLPETKAYIKEKYGV